MEKWKWKETFYRKVPKIAFVSTRALTNQVHLAWQILLMIWLCFLFIIDVHQPSRPSTPSGADICLPGFLSLSLKCVMNGSVSCLIGDNSRNCNLRILPDCHISIWYYLYCIRAYYFLLLLMCLFTTDFSSSLAVATFAFLKHELDQEAVNSFQRIWMDWFWSDVTSDLWHLYLWCYANAMCLREKCNNQALQVEEL